MKKISITLTVLSVMALVAFSSCQKDDVLVTEFNVSMEGFSGDSKTVLNGRDLYWVPGDCIKVFGAANSNFGTYEYMTEVSGRIIPFHHVNGNSGEAPYRAIYPASCADVNGRLVLPGVQQTPDGSLTGYPMYTESSTTSLDFKNLGGVLALKLKKSGVSVSSIQVTANSNLSGTFSINYNDGNPTLTDVSGSNSVTLACATAQSIESYKFFYIAVPDRDYSFLQIKIFTADGKVCTKTVYSGSVSVTRSNITTIALEGNDINFSSKAGELPGLFSIADGVKACFSCGNMQYTAVGTHAVAGGGTANGAWRFAPNQYEYVGLDNVNVSSSYDGWIDLFGWGTSGWCGPNANIYQPYSYGGASNHYGYGSNDLSGDYANADWAVYNAISNGGNQPNMWRCLTRDEWMYVTSGRDNYDTKRGTGKVNGIGGLILLPDNWSQPDGCPVFQSGYSDEQDVWGPNSYTISEWAKMEANGAVFLPAAGSRSLSGNSSVAVSFVGRRGGYWSVTAHGTLNAIGPYILSVIPGAGSDYDYYYNRQVGLSVRPVKVVQAQQ